MSSTSTLGFANTSTSLVAPNALVADGRSLDALRGANADNPQAVREAAKQFEALFMREMIKSMRDATMKSGLLQSSGGDLATDMLDQQLSVQVASNGGSGSLTEALLRQLAPQMANQPASASGEANDAASAGNTGFSPSTLSLPQVLRSLPAHVMQTVQSALNPSGTSSKIPNGPTKPDDPNAAGPKGRDDFVQHHRRAAERVASASGIPANFMLGQAGHETGWGKGQIRSADGSNSFNLFGIKATGGWTGKVAEVTTTEYINGVAQKVKAKFRAYNSYEESFRDYARLITENPRYEKAKEKVNSALAYAQELQKAGYATDPAYANKLSRAIDSVARAGNAGNAQLNQALARAKQAVQASSSQA